MVWILQLALCRHAAQIYRETVPQVTALILGIICIESTAATWNNSIQVWQKDFKGSIYEEIISVHQSTLILFPLLLPEIYPVSLIWEVKKLKEVKDNCHALERDKEQGGELTVIHYREKVQ